MYDPGNNRFVPIPPELMEKFNGPTDDLTPMQTLQRDWTRFEEGETITVKGINFTVDEIGETRIVLKPINKVAFAERTVSKLQEA